MPEYLLPLSVLHAAAPGILDVVFGKDGAGDNRPNFTGPVYGSAGGYAPGWWHIEGFDGADVLLMNDAIGERDALSLSALLPSTACRLAGLCLRAAGDLPSAPISISAGRSSPKPWTTGSIPRPPRAWSRSPFVGRRRSRRLGLSHELPPRTQGLHQRRRRSPRARVNRRAVCEPRVQGHHGRRDQGVAWHGWCCSEQLVLT